MARKPYPRYSREFKLEAVRQAPLGEKPKAQIARALGIRVGHLRDWRLQFEEEARTGVTKPPPAVSQDLEQLRRENAKLKRTSQRDIEIASARFSEMMKDRR